MELITCDTCGSIAVLAYIREGDKAKCMTICTKCDFEAASNSFVRRNLARLILGKTAKILQILVESKLQQGQFVEMDIGDSEG